MKLDALWLQLPGAFFAGILAERGQDGAALVLAGVQLAMIYYEHLARRIAERTATLRLRVVEMKQYPAGCTCPHHGTDDARNRVTTIGRH